MKLIRDLGRRSVPASWRQTVTQWSVARALWRKVAGLRFSCAALSGESNYNICINSDLTVSCNCLDYEGEGILGDLNRQTMAEIFEGETAQRFRDRLAQGKYAIPYCASCTDLRVVDPVSAERPRTEFHTPTRGLMVENTVACNLKCLYCRRDSARRIRRRTTMSLDDLRKVAETLKECGLQSIAYHNLGEPFLSPRIGEELQILREYNPDLNILASTNGLLLDAAEKREAALKFDHLLFSMDGPSQDILIKYQLGGDFDRAYQNMKDLAALRDARGLKAPTIEWKYVVFRWNDQEEHIERAIQLATEAGADMISFWPGGGGPRSSKSRRFIKSPYFQTLGSPSWKGREIFLRRSQNPSE